MDSSFERRYSVPVLINVATAVVCSTLYFVLQYAASHTDSVPRMIVYGLAFAVVMIPVYSLIHEAEHNMLLPQQRGNDLLGEWLCALFVVSFTFFRHCHLRHHKKNRTDIEIWDLYLKPEDKWKRRANLYLMMSGLGYLALWLSVLVFAVLPSLAHGSFFRRHTEIAGFLEGIDDGKTAMIRRESWLVLLFQAAAFWALDLHFLPWLLLFLIHGFVWSSQNYVNHAFSPRDVIHGAHNLRMPRWLRPIYLNFNLHLAHHQNPHIPWPHLPRFVREGTVRMSFFWNYLRLWHGPRFTSEAVAPLRRIIAP